MAQLLAERGVRVNPSTIFARLRAFAPPCEAAAPLKGASMPAGAAAGSSQLATLRVVANEDARSFVTRC